MLQNKFEPRELIDSISSFEGGNNSGIAPLILPKNQLAKSLNTTVRGSYVRPRPTFQKIELDEASDALLQAAFNAGTYQGGCFYNPDNGAESMRILLAGKLIQVTPDATTATAADLSIPGDPNPSTQPQAWIWQSEKWTIWQDGLSNPIFTDETTSRRSNYGTQIPFDETTASSTAIPAIGASFSIDFTSTADLLVNDIVVFKKLGRGQVLTIAGATVTLNNLSLAPEGQTIAVGVVVSWKHQGTELPPGRMGTYGLGRNWLSLVDGKQFVASDLVGGASGTIAEDYRDAVLNITENLYLAGGGNFTVPGSAGDIRAMRFTATLDVSLGQGPLQVFTPTSVFSCNAPVDRLAWQDLTNPILTESLISNGGLAQDATINANGDIIFRSVDGIRSLILARREFNTWGNVPISREVEPQLQTDSTDLLGYASAIVFDNRLLMTATPVLSDRGVYWRSLIPLNFDPLSTLRGKAPSVYDSLQWSGLNVFQLITGLFNNLERAFAFCYNLNNGKLELYEILKSSSTEINDNGTDRIVWTGESSALFRYPPGHELNTTLKRLQDGEIHVDEIPPNTTVDFFFWYKPDEHPCWVPWFSWSECAGSGNKQFRPRMGLGTPSRKTCEQVTNRPAPEGYTFRVKWMIVGKCQLLNAQFKAVTVPQTEFAKQSCLKICVGTEETKTVKPVTDKVVFAILDAEGLAILDADGNAILQAGSDDDAPPVEEPITDLTEVALTAVTAFDGSSVTLTWSTPAATFDHYQLFRNGAFLLNIPYGDTSYIDTMVVSGESYDYELAYEL